MTAKSVMIKELECDSCKVKLESRDARALAVRELARANGWVLQPRKGAMFGADYQPARDLCPDCAKGTAA